jgi:hypothetical protein
MHLSDRPTPPRELLERIRADPWRSPETIALAAAERHAPPAAEWAARLRTRYAHGDLRLARMTKADHASYARFGGAAMGVGGIFTMLPDLATLAWIQSRLVFFVAAAFRFDPRDPMRPAELLVLQGLYPDPLVARRALDGEAAAIAQTWVGKRLSGDEASVERLARMAGAKAGKKFGGKLIPGYAVLHNAIANERSTRALADKAIGFYGGT